jgi:hypothetical protein
MASPFFQNPAHGGAADLELACDRGFADARTEELSHPLCVQRCCRWPAQPLSIFSGMSQTGTNSQHSVSLALRGRARDAQYPVPGIAFGKLLKIEEPDFEIRLSKSG